MDDLTADDHARLVGITNAAHMPGVVSMIYEYYHDLDRANRTPREWLYLHMGMLTAHCRASTETP